MLSCLQIENFTLIDRLELTFGNGLNVLTGETGAGKSIILDAIDIVLGGKVNHRVIRQGSQQSTLEATFSLTPELIAWLESQEIDPLELSDVLTWQAKFDEISEQLVNSSLNPEDKISKLKALVDANQPTLNRLPITVKMQYIGKQATRINTVKGKSNETIQN